MSKRRVVVWLRNDLRLTDSAAEGVFRSAVQEVLAAPYKAATDALKLQNTPGALASVSRLMDVQKGVETVVKTAPFLSGAQPGAAAATIRHYHRRQITKSCHSCWPYAAQHLGGRLPPR